MSQAGAAAAKARLREASETRILDAAATVFARLGLSGATMAEIAREADTPTATIHYYFGTKHRLYQAVLADTLRLWVREIESIGPEDEPRTAIAAYIAAKMRFSRLHPEASRIFAGEMLAGGGNVREFLAGDLRLLIERKAAILATWVARGLIRPMAPEHLFFLIWGATEFYANFAPEVRAVTGLAEDEPIDFDGAALGIADIVLNGCLAPESGDRDGHSPDR
ncbi:TetR family transcriptional regulator C-terminal domain-containing protein [Skermanella stibiiresistens]|uniref:TetR family transcriptional regulator C-terminal domain-containing protein n=1 Tax=Skermanella stibiiresistens TaxID=913326 RepID=UPI0004BBBB6B|nr:TetR family transcriptional regulator C-terminal domain-containing protein [Skermanella stibiiresistens]